MDLPLDVQQSCYVVDNLIVSLFVFALLGVIQVYSRCPKRIKIHLK